MFDIWALGKIVREPEGGLWEGIRMGAGRFHGSDAVMLFGCASWTKLVIVQVCIVSLHHDNSQEYDSEVFYGQSSCLNGLLTV
jgi:hypothetical protein